MDDPQKPKVWWTESDGTTRRVIAITSLIALVFAVFVLWPDIQNVLSALPWWKDVIAALPAIALVVLAYLELRHSGEANVHRAEANRLRAEANELQDRIGELEAERNIHLQQIAENTKKTITQAERNAATLRKYLRASVAVSEEHGTWPGSPEIVEVNDEIVTLFTPSGYSSSTAWCVQVHCADLAIAEIPQGSCPLSLKVNKRYGPNVQLGQITKWEDRHQPAATPSFSKGGTVRHATYNKPGSPETRSLYIYASSGGANSFLLEASTGEKFVGDNTEISKRFVILQVEYEAAGFTCNSSGSGGSPHPLFIH